MKKLIALLLCLVMCVPLFAACGGDDPQESDGPDTTKAPETSQSAVVTTEPEGNDTTDPDIPEQTIQTAAPYEKFLPEIAVNDWDEYVFKIYYSKADGTETDFICDSPNGNVLNDQVYARNLAVEELLNITLDVTPHSTAYATVLQNQHSAGWTENDYNMVTGSNRDAIQLSLKGYLANIADYDSMNIYKPYWEQGFVESLMIDDSIYALIGDYSVTANLFVESICFNKNLFSENGFDEPYNLVKNYEWTVDVLLDYMDSFTTYDYDNNGFEWEKDVYAITGWGTEAAYGIFYGSGFTYCKNDGEGIAIDFDKEILDDVLDVCIEVWGKNDSYFIDTGLYADCHKPGQVFAEGRSLFFDVVLFKVSMWLTEMEDDYGILPIPMFSEDQGRYYTYTGYTLPILLIPATDPNPDRTGNILEAISAASNDIIIPKMFEIVTKIQNARDEDSAAMIDIIISNKIFDAAHWLKLTGYQDLSRSLIKERQNAASGYIAVYHKKAEGELKTFLESYDNLKK